MITGGRPLLIWRLVIRDIKRRRLQSLLLVVMIVTTTTTLSVGLALRNTTQSSFARTRELTRGPDLVVANGPGPGFSRPAPSQFKALVHAPGVQAEVGPFPVAFTRLTAPGISVPVDAEGRDRQAAAVDQPFLTFGRWVRPGGVVVERGLASSLGLHVGDVISLGGHPLRICGIAVTTARPFYPAVSPGLVWIGRSEAGALATSSEPLGYVLDIKLVRAASLDALDAAINRFGAAAHVPSTVDFWQDIRHFDYRAISLDQKILFVGSWLLATLAIASIAVLVGGRVAEQTRRVGLLKAVGATPLLIAIVLLAENLLLALIGAIVGLGAGWLLAPGLANPGGGVLGPAPTPTLTVSSAAVVIGVAAVIAAAATFGPAIRGARASTMRALTGPAQRPGRRRLVISASAALPVPILIGVRLVARRARRTVLTAASLAVAVAMVVAALTVQRNLEVTHQGQASVGFLTETTNVQGANHVLIVISVVLVVLAAISATFTAWATVIDAQVMNALSRALGATPRQVSAGLTTAQLLPGLLAVLIGIPAGLLLYEAAGGDLTEARPPILWLLGLIPVTLVAVAVLTAVPARIAARRPVAEVLRAE